MRILQGLLLWVMPMMMGFFLAQPTVQAGVFNLPHFVQPGEFAVGAEPEVILSNGAGIGANLKYVHGLNELMNVTTTIGTGSGPRKFRVGGALTFDFFPDIEGQPGIGVAAQAMYYNLKTGGRFDLQAIPYLHKSFASGEEGQAVEPFVGFPFGMGFKSGTYETITHIAVGSLFKTSEHVSYVVEVGVNINHSESYVSGGLIYFH